MTLTNKANDTIKVYRIHRFYDEDSENMEIKVREEEIGMIGPGEKLDLGWGGDFRTVTVEPSIRRLP